MTRPKIALPFTDWPANWQTAWHVATTPAKSLFAASAQAAKLRPHTLAMYKTAAGVYLGWLRRTGQMAEASPPAISVTEAQIQGLVDDMRARELRNTTISLHLRSLYRALQMMAPGLDLEFLRRPGGRPMRQVLPMTPRRPVVSDQQELLDHVLALHAEGLSGKSYAHGHTALRDAAILGVLVCHGTRSRALSGMEIGRHLQRRQDNFWLCFEGDDTKTGHAYEVPLPDLLTPIIDAYLTIARPAMGGAGTASLWLSTRGKPLSLVALVEMVRIRTRRWTGTAHGPHWLRKCITTTVRLTTPARARDVAIVLDHSMQIAQLHYDMGTGVAAATRHSERMARKISDATARADAAYRSSTDAHDFRTFRYNSMTK